MTDIIGKQYHRLTVVARAPDKIYKGRHYKMWLCKCTCGNNKDVIASKSDLDQEKIKSCGCLNREKLLERNYKKNRFDLSGNYGIGLDCNNNEFYFDLDDYDKIKNYCWHIDSYGYVVSQSNNTNSRMHRLIMAITDSTYEVDHINHDKKDNRKNNLRIVTKSQNQMNIGIMKHNTSGVTGVSYAKRDNVWRAYIEVNKKHINLGSFESFDKAVNARKEAEEKYFGEYSYNNSINKEATL